MTRSTRFSLTTFALGAAVAGSVIAQAPVWAQGAHGTAGLTAIARVAAPAVAPQATLEAQPGPTAERARVGVQAVRATEPRRPHPAPIPTDSSRNRQKMIVGGTAFIAGAIISGSNGAVGTIVMLGGAGIGLWGLYRYLE